ncbi:hypothetical protein BGZ58_005021 [Dissophora ornata]|nr:hypothetical protein BGZ58_005021 [Dissophora ornata]
MTVKALVSAAEMYDKIYHYKPENTGSAVTLPVVPIPSQMHTPRDNVAMELDNIHMQLNAITRQLSGNNNGQRNSNSLPSICNKIRNTNIRKQTNKKPSIPPHKNAKPTKN